MEFQLQEMNKWDERFFSLCNLVGSWSEDKSRKVGAVIVGTAHEIRSTGYNGLPRGINSEVALRHDRTDGEKYFWFEHAERNAIFNAARSGTSIENTTIYCSLFPCADCVRAIIQSGIIHLKTYKIPNNEISFVRSFEVSTEMLKEAGIQVSLYKQGT